jgi:primosomal protein N' (replication factor Y)
VEHDVERFVGIEAPSREDAGYPPYGRMGLIRIESKDCALAQAVAEYVAKAARAAAGTAPLRIVGPAPAPIERLRERWRFRIMLMAEKPAHLVATMRRVQMQFDDLPRKVDLIFDVDPLDML